MKALPSPESVRPQLVAYGTTVFAAYEAFHQSPDADRFASFADAILGFLGDPPEPKSPFRAEWDLQTDLGMDSIALAEAAFIVEDLFGVRLDNATLQAIRTVGDLRKTLARHVSTERSLADASASS